MGYQICNRCVMDTSDLEIQFDHLGNCNHCNNYFNNFTKLQYHRETSDKIIRDLVKKIKDTGSILPGHGGLLDRFDGILFGIPFGIISDILLTNSGTDFLTKYNKSASVISPLFVISPPINILLFTTSSKPLSNI